MNQTDVLGTIKPPSWESQVDVLIRRFMADYGLGYYSPNGVDAPWASADFNSDGRVTGEGQWRALRRFAKEVREL